MQAEKQPFNVTNCVFLRLFLAFCLRRFSSGRRLAMRRVGEN